MSDAHWRELKVGAWFPTRAQPPTRPGGTWSIQAENVHYYADICEADVFSSLVWSSGFQHHAQLAQELIMLGDDARWIWDLVEEHHPQAIQIVDWFHACAYLEPVATIAFSDPAQKAVTYFTNNRQRMDYPCYRANGYHIGSGTIESGIKQIAAQRMKVSGAIWNLPSARKVAKARAAYLSDDWDVLATRRTRLDRAA